VTLGAYDHQDVPFEQLVHELKVERAMNYSPLFQAMLTLQNTPKKAVDMGRLKFSTVERGNRSAKFDLMLELGEEASGLSGVLGYNTDLFDAGTIERMVRHLERLLGEMADKPQARLSQLEILSEAEREQLLVTWNDTVREYPKEKCVHELFEEQAKRQPEAVAVEYEGRALTYRELDERTNQLAYYLKRLGAGPEVRVAICAERSLEMVVGLLGILKVGAAYVPLDPDYPRERLAFMLEDAQVKLLLTQEHVARLLVREGVQVVFLDRGWPEIARCPKTHLVCRLHASNLAYVIYTSGSTGLPKGAANTHGGLCNRLDWMQKEYGLTEADRVLQKTPFSFDVSVW
jgi:non-ribosomal peptide synthetase component F